MDKRLSHDRKPAQVQLWPDALRSAQAGCKIKDSYSNAAFAACSSNFRQFFGNIASYLSLAGLFAKLGGPGWGLREQKVMKRRVMEIL